MTQSKPTEVQQAASNDLLSGWQPIETAPKDGTKFIGLWNGLVYTVKWQKYYDKWPHQEGGPTFRGGWSAETWDQHMPCRPTYWMPQPEAR